MNPDGPRTPAPAHGRGYDLPKCWEEWLELSALAGASEEANRTRERLLADPTFDAAGLYREYAERRLKRSRK